MAMERFELTRDCDVVQIPIGTAVTLEKGTEVYLMQSLGGSYTVQAPAYGGLFRIAGRDADAIGKEPIAPPVEAAAEGDLESQVWSALKTCYDPEIPVNIVDLGLVYDMRISDEGDDKRVDVKMTLTAQGCPSHVMIGEQVKARVEQMPGVRNATVNVVWTPPWTPERLSPDARKTLGIE